MPYLIIPFILILILIMIIVILRTFLSRLTVYEYERGLKYEDGRFSELLPPGSYWYLPFSTTIRKVDIRPRFVTIAGQEVLSADSVTLKVSLAAKYEIIDPELAINHVADYQQALYLELQLALREIIGAEHIERMLVQRQQLSTQLLEATVAKAHELGLKLIDVNLKDIMFPGQLKQIFAQVVKARQEGLAALEKARGETAALRNLANAAKMLEKNPNLMQLRLLQALGESQGSTLVLGLPPEGGVIWNQDKS